MISLVGQETPTDYGAEAGTKMSLTDLSTDLKLPATGNDAETPNSLGGEAGAGAPQTGGAMTHPAADAGTLEAAAETGLKMGVMAQNLGHEAPPCANRPRGLPAIYLPLSR